MPLGSIDMYGLAQRDAMQAGPRQFNIRGENRIAYGMTKAELRLLFLNKKYNVSKRSRWKGCIAEWVDPDLLGNVLTVNPKILRKDEDDDRDWAVIFIHIGADAMTKLQMAAEDTGLKPLPTREMWDHVCGY